MSAATLPEKFVVMSPDGRLMRADLRLTDLGPRDDILLRATGEAAGVPIHNMCALPGTTPPMPVHFLASGQSAMAVRLPHIRLNTLWDLEEAEGKHVIYPVFKAEGAIDRSLTWVPPDGCAIYIVVRAATPYLVAVGQKDNGNWFALRLDLPNLFDDARICMGDDWVTPDEKHGSHVERFSKFVDSVYSSRWNGHILNATRMANARKLIRFDATTGQQLPPTIDWRIAGQEVSSSGYNWLVGLAAARRSAP